MITTFICANCNKPSIIKLMALTTDYEYLGVAPCECKGKISEQPKKETNVTSLILYREQRGAKK